MPATVSEPEAAAARAQVAGRVMVSVGPVVAPLVLLVVLAGLVQVPV